MKVILFTILPSFFPLLYFISVHIFITRMSHQHIETNPHFIDPEEITPEQRHYIPSASLPHRVHDQQDRRLRPRQSADERPQPLGPSPPETDRDGQPPLPLHVWMPPAHHEGQRPQSQLPRRQGQQRQPLEMWMPPPSSSSTQGPTPKKPKRRDQYPSSSSSRPQGAITEADDPKRGVTVPQHQGSYPQERNPPTGRLLPRDRQTKPLTRSAAAVCIIFCLILIIGGLIILIVYLVSRPRSPGFDLSSVTLNAAYLDMGYLFNADLSLLANFTNPNKKVSVDFSHMYLDLYFQNTLIATQYIEPFSAAGGQSMFANIRMMTSQVDLSTEEALLFQDQMENDRVMFTVKGRFRARSNLGGFFKYSYWLHGYCGIMVSSPPTGVLKEKKCRTKH